jgi:hypothetical protein
VNDLTIELNIALLPSPALASRLTALSEEFSSRYPAIVRLGDDASRLSLAPHLTLYQVPVPVADLSQLHEGLHKIAQGTANFTLACTGLAYNAGEASLEARTEAPESLVAVQGAVIDIANPIRGGLVLDRDPAGNRVADLLDAMGPFGDNIRRTGYAEVGDPRAGGLFRPHDTLNWFEPGTVIDAERESRAIEIAALGGDYPALGLFTLGPYGTCPQLLARYEFEA